MEKWIKTQNGDLVKPNNILYFIEYGRLEVITRLGHQSYIVMGTYNPDDEKLIRDQIQDFIENGIVNLFVMP